MIFYLYIIASTVFYLVGDYFGKLWIVNNKASFFALAFVPYVVAALFFILALRKSDSIALTTLAFSLVGLLGGVVMGYFVFGERLNLFQTFGLGFALLAIILVGFPFEKIAK